MALPKYYKFVLKNECGETLPANAVTLKILRWKFDSSGNLTYESSVTSLTNAADIANGAYGDIGSAQDNSTALYLGGFFTLIIDATSLTGPSGNVILYMHISTDNVDYDSNGLGRVLAVINVNAVSTFKRSGEF